MEIQERRPMTTGDMLAKARSGNGFIAALDQSGGSTPKALGLYGIDESGYANTDEMFNLVHEMRTRIMTSPSFGGDRILGAILFEMTMDRQVEGMDTAEYLWQKKGIVPFLKCDKGLAEVHNGVQMMKPMPQLGALLARANTKHIFGTKMRSVIKNANAEGIAAIVDQQFAIARQIIDAGLVPIIEPEVDIHSPTKAEAEQLLVVNLMRQIKTLGAGQNVMLKLTLPEQDNLYAECAAHENVVRVVALSGGYTRAQACDKLSRNNKMIASFSRALSQGLSVDQDDAAFHQTIDGSIQAIYDASLT
jgi:fructose-bisphosphate aldolase class I